MNRQGLSALFNAIIFALTSKIASFVKRRGISLSPFVTVILIILVIAVGGIIIYLVVVSGPGTTTTYP